MATFTGILERTTRRYSGQLTDETGITPVPLAQLVAATLTLYSIHSLAVINGRENQNILNANGVTIDANGGLVWVMEPDDNAILDDALLEEQHVALFTWTWAGGNRIGRWETTFIVRNLSMLATPVVP